MNNAIHFPDTLQEDISLALAWHWTARPGFSPDEGYQGPAALERKKRYLEVISW